MIAKTTLKALPFTVKNDFVADTNDVLWHVYKRLANGNEKLIKTFKTRGGAISACRSKNLGHFQKQGFTGFDLVKEVTS